MNCSRCRLLLINALACWAWLFTPALCHAGAYTYNSGVSQRTVNAGILVLSPNELGAGALGATAEDNPDPYVFYVLSKRADVLPYGWSIVNPLAPKNVTAAIQQRWSAALKPTPRPNTGREYEIAETITSNMAAYWEVPLPQATSDDLAQFDVLLLDIKGGIVTFTAADSEKLRRFVDGGGTLLIEGGAGGKIGNANGLFISTITFAGSGGPPTSPATDSLLTSTPNNPTVQGILSTPYFLQTTDLDTLARNGPADYSFALSGNALGAMAPALAFKITNTPTIAAAGSYGAGSIVTESTYIARVINGIDATGVNLRDTTVFDGSVEPTGATAGPTTASLKFLANIIAWGAGHNGERHSSHQDGNSFSSFPSPVRLWNYNVTGGGTAAPAAVIYGSMAYVVDAAGKLHAFDINPAEDIVNPYGLLGLPVPDNRIGTTTQPDYSTGTSYDEVWTVDVGTLSSAPVVTVDDKGNTLVLVEKSDASVVEYDAASGTLIKTITSATPASFSTSAAPAPVVYNGYIYVTQGDGTFYADNIATPITGPTPYLPVSPAIPNTGAMAVGIIPVDSAVSGMSPPTNDIVALMPTQQFLYSVLLGSRGEALISTGNLSIFKTKLFGTGAVSTVAPSRAYTLDTNGDGFIDPANPGTLSGNRFTMTNPSQPGTVFGDYNTELDPSKSGTSLTRTRVAFASSGIMNTVAGGTPPTANISTAAMDRFGNACFVTNDLGLSTSSLVSFHDSVTPGNIRINWRFRLPTTKDKMPLDGTITDADGRNYNAADNSNLVGYTFVNEAPVVDERGNVYALATNSTTNRVAVLCINGLQPVTTGPANGPYLAQPVPAITGTATGTIVDEFGQTPMPYSGGLPVDGQAPTGQYVLQATPANATVSPSINILNFGKQIGGGVLRSIYPNMSEPQSLSISYDSGKTYTEVKLHTNLAWYTVLPDTITPNTGGMTKAGGSLFFVDGRGHLISVIADPTSAGLPVVAKYVDSTPAVSSLPSMVTDYGNTGVGAGGGATPSIANGVLVVNGPKGITGYVNRVTVVADSSRVMELNSSGDATWVTDSTIGAPATTALSQAGVATATSQELNHPSSITELTANDYLIADTGNNRCVRFSRSGKVIWELSRVNDDIIDPTVNADAVLKALFKKTGPMLSSGEPDTLNQPTSVQIRTEAVDVRGGIANPSTAANFTPNYTVVHYLISDSGNYRILEVVDVFDASGNIVGSPHNLVWVSHTHDKQQRDFRYQSAAFFPPNATPTNIVALVTNRRVALDPNSAAGALMPANTDSAGASIVVVKLTHDPADATDGTIVFAQSKMRMYLTATNGFDVDRATQDINFTNADLDTAATRKYVFIRNPRYLKAYVPQVVSSTNPYNFLLADDNGVFDIRPVQITTGGYDFFPTWGMTQADYWTINTPLDTAMTKYPRGGSIVAPLTPLIPFIPYSIQRTATDQVGNANVGRYLITNGYSQGDASSAGGAGFGGEILEVGINYNGTYYSQVTTAHTLGRPTNTSPLSQPTFAYRVP